MFNYEQRPIDDKARDNYDRIFGHGKHAEGAEDSELPPELFEGNNKNPKEKEKKRGKDTT